jgi:hypothetical protein
MNCAGCSSKISSRIASATKQTAETLCISRWYQMRRHNRTQYAGCYWL